MKRFLIILMMLSGLSNAQWPSILELSFNGMMNGEGVDQAFTLFASDSVTIGVYCIAEPSNVDWNLAVQGPGSLAGLGTIYSPPAPLGVMIDYLASYPYLPYSAYLNFRASPTTVTPNVGKWWDVEFHCDGPGVVTVMLMDETGYIVDDTITITQMIPEPMTVGLLALGGVFLRRRK